MELVSEGVVTYETAMTASSNPADFELQMRTLRRRTMTAHAPVVEPSPAAAEPDRPAGFTDDLSSMLPGE
jgi:hypothetical protein